MFKYALIASAALAIALGVQTYRIGNLKYKIEQQEKAIASLKAEVKSCNDIRAVENNNAKASYEGLQASCKASVSQALANGRIIERVVYGQKNADGSSVDVDADSLRTLTGQK